MPRSARAWASVALLVLVFAHLAAAQGTGGSVKALLSDPDRYDGRTVTLAGAVTRLQVRVSRLGNAYFTFELDDGSGRVTVFAFGEPPCPSGRRVTIEGEFHRVKTVSGYTFHDQVDARRVVCR